jgi:integrase/recombinase XerD
MNNNEKNITYSSTLAHILTGFVKEKQAVGYTYKKGASVLRQLDELCICEGLEEETLPKDIVLLWINRRTHETDATQNGRISIIRCLAEYMARLNYPAYIYPNRAHQIERNQYVPYIFSEKEISSIFYHVDTYPVSSVSPNRHLILPVLFRMLYGCGLRISEALNLKVEDVDLQKGIISIHHAKLDKERIVPMSPSLTKRCRLYSASINMKSNAFFFPSPYGEHFNERTLYGHFRKILWNVGISHGGRGRGPRLHDFRHTYAVHCLKKWVTEGKDLSSLLPYLSVYLGHVDLRGTQYYLRLTAELYPAIVAAVEEKFSIILPEVNES